MPITHKLFGNLFFSLLLKIFFLSPFNDVYCGMRAFKRQIALKHSYICDGMQFALENLIKLLLTSKNVTEIPQYYTKTEELTSWTSKNSFRWS